MVHLSKLLKLGGFSEQVRLLRQQVEHFGFARKALPPDTPHSEDKTRWSVNALGQKVVDTGTPIEVTRKLYIDLAEKTYIVPEDASLDDRAALVVERCDHIRSICVLAEKGDEASGEYLLGVLEKDPSPAVRRTVLTRMIFAARGPPTPYNRRLVEGSLVALGDPVSSCSCQRHSHAMDQTSDHCFKEPAHRNPGATLLPPPAAPPAPPAPAGAPRGAAVGGGKWQEAASGPEWVAMGRAPPRCHPGPQTLFRHWSVDTV